MTERVPLIRASRVHRLVTSKTAHHAPPAVSAFCDVRWQEHARRLWRVIVWINGVFGVGKTSTAAELVSLLPQMRVCNPERLGWFLQRTVGLLRPGDFQHLHSWRPSLPQICAGVGIDQVLSAPTG